MKLLALDTSFQACSVALLNTSKPLENQVLSYHQPAFKQQGTLILPAIESMLLAANMSLFELDALVFSCGPGSYTGVRIASSVVQGMAYAANLPIIRISSLAALAQAAFLAHHVKNLLVAVDAHMNEIYWAYYKANLTDCVELIGKEILINPKKIILSPNLNKHNKQKSLKDLEKLNSFDGMAAIFAMKKIENPELMYLGVGNGWEIQKEALTNKLGFTPSLIDSSILPTAEALLSLAKVKISAGECKKPGEAMPIYIR